MDYYYIRPAVCRGKTRNVAQCRVVCRAVRVDSNLRLLWFQLSSCDVSPALSRSVVGTGEFGYHDENMSIGHIWERWFLSLGCSSQSRRHFWWGGGVSRTSPAYLFSSPSPQSIAWPLDGKIAQRSHRSPLCSESSSIICVLLFFKSQTQSCYKQVSRRYPAIRHTARIPLSYYGR